MVNYAQLLDLDTSKLTTAATTAGSLGSALSSRGSEVSSVADIPSGMWDGADAQAAISLLNPQSGPLFDASDAFSQSQGILEDLAEGLEKAKSMLADAKGLADGAGITIGADGTVTTPVVPDPGLAERNDELARQIRELIDEGLRMADEVDGIAVEEIEGKRPLAGILDMWGSGEFSLDENGLGLNGEGGVGLKEKLLLGENGEYGSVTGMLGAEGNGNLSLGPTGLNAGIGGFAGASGNYTTPDMGLAPGVDGKVGVTGRAGVGAEAGLNLGYDDGKFQLGGKVGASWGLGGSISPSISIDVPEVAGGIVDAGKAVNNVMPWNW